MRPAVVAGLVLAVLPAAARGDGPRYATVTDAEVLLRAGPSDKYPDTGTLPAGARVVVDHEEQGGWYAVVAPPGSVSWVPFALVDFDGDKPVPQNVVTGGPTTLAPGRVGHAQPLAGVGRCKLDGPTVLMAVGPPVKADGRLWLPVAPPDGDYRYVPRSAVRVDGPANTSFTVGTGASGVSPAGATVPAAGLPPPAGGPAGATHPLWARADEADRAGRYDEAEALFFQVARETADHDLANRCYSRIHTLREKKRGGPAPAGGSRPAVAQDGGRTTSADTGSRTATLLPPAGTGSPRTDRADPPAAADRPGWTGGMLVKSGLVISGQTAYGLESAPGVVKAYVVPGPGVDLTRHLNRAVELYGTPQTRRDLSKPYLVATDVQPGR